MTDSSGIAGRKSKQRGDAGSSSSSAQAAAQQPGTAPQVPAPAAHEPLSYDKFKHIGEDDDDEDGLPPPALASALGGPGGPEWTSQFHDTCKDCLDQYERHTHVRSPPCIAGQARRRACSALPASTPCALAEPSSEHVRHVQDQRQPSTCPRHRPNLSLEDSEEDNDDDEESIEEIDYEPPPPASRAANGSASAGSPAANGRSSASSKPLQAGFFDKGKDKGKPSAAAAAAGPSEADKKRAQGGSLAPGFLSKGSAKPKGAAQAGAAAAPPSSSSAGSRPGRRAGCWVSPLDFAPQFAHLPGARPSGPCELSVKFYGFWTSLCEEHAGQKRLGKLQDCLRHFCSLGLEETMEHYARRALPAAAAAAAVSAA